MTFICLLPTTYPCPTQTAVPSVALVTNWPILMMMETFLIVFCFFFSLHFIWFIQACAYCVGGGYQLWKQWENFDEETPDL